MWPRFGEVWLKINQNNYMINAALHVCIYSDVSRVASCGWRIIRTSNPDACFILLWNLVNRTIFFPVSSFKHFLWLSWTPLMLLTPPTWCDVQAKINALTWTAVGLQPHKRTLLLSSWVIFNNKRLWRDPLSPLSDTRTGFYHQMFWVHEASYSHLLKFMWSFWIQ